MFNIMDGNNLFVGIYGEEKTIDDLTRKKNELYWKERSEGAYINNPDRELFVKREGELDLECFMNFVKEKNIEFPERYVSFLNEHNGLEVDKRIKMYLVKGEYKCETTVTLLLPFKQALSIYENLQGVKAVCNSYFPIALGCTCSSILLIKTKGKNQGKIYYYDHIMKKKYIVFECVEDFFEVLGLE